MAKHGLIQRFEFHSLGRAACRDDGRMAAATVAGAVPALALCWDRRRPTSTAAGAAADSLADDSVGVVAAVPVLPVEGGTQVPPGDDDELVPRRQRIGLADVWEDKVSQTLAGDALYIVVSHGVIDVGGHITGPPDPVMDDVNCGFAQGDVDDLEGAVGGEKKTRGTVAGVAGEVEPRPVAAGVAKAEGVRHAHVAAASAAVGLGHPSRHRRHRRQPHICIK